MDLPTIESCEREVHQKLLFILLKLISASTVHLAIVACERLLLLMKKISAIFESFSPNEGLLKQLNLNRIFIKDKSFHEVLFDFIVFVIRYYPEIQLKWFDLEDIDESILRREETKRLWLTIDHLVSKYDMFSDEFKNRNNLTAKALGEVFSYIDALKKDIHNIGNVGGGSNNDKQTKITDNLKKEIGNLKEEIDTIKKGIIKNDLIMGTGVGRPETPTKLRNNKEVDTMRNADSTSTDPSLNLQLKMMQNDIQDWKAMMQKDIQDQKVAGAKGITDTNIQTTNNLGNPTNKDMKGVAEDTVTRFEFEKYRREIMDLTDTFVTRNEWVKKAAGLAQENTNKEMTGVADKSVTRLEFEKYKREVMALTDTFLSRNDHALTETFVTRKEWIKKDAGVAQDNNTANLKELFSEMNKNKAVDGEVMTQKYEMLKKTDELQKEISTVKQEMVIRAEGESYKDYGDTIKNDNEVKILKKKMRAFESEFESINKNIRKLTIDSKRNYGAIQKSLDTEIEGQNQYKERVDIEVDTMKRHIQGSEVKHRNDKNPQSEGDRTGAIGKLDLDTEILIKKVERDANKSINLSIEHKIDYEHFKKETVAAIEIIDIEMKKMKQSIDEEGSKSVIHEGKDGAKYDIGRIAKQNNYQKRKLDEVTTDLRDRISKIQIHQLSERSSGAPVPYKTNPGTQLPYDIEEVDSRVIQLEKDFQIIGHLERDIHFLSEANKNLSSVVFLNNKKRVLNI